MDQCFMKIHMRGDQNVVGVCDQEHIGKVLRNGNLKFDVSENFFKDQLIPINEALILLKKSTNFNVVGSKIINLLIEDKVIHPESVIFIADIPITIKFLF